MLLDSMERLNIEYNATIMMVTHDAFTASYAHRILFIKDGKIFNEIVRSESSRKDFFNQIMEVVTLLGGGHEQCTLNWPCAMSRRALRTSLSYFLTLTFSVCLFYTFNSFQSQQAVMKLNDSQLMIVDQLTLLMRLVSIFVAVVLAFLILYANNFLIRRRKKELGLYTMLGMPRGKISRVLVYETLTIGIISLISGMILGLIVSQVLTAVTANLFAVPLDYHFVFSPSATIMTVFSFSMIFFITMIFNTMVLNRYKLIDLLNADRRNDDLKIKKVWMSSASICNLHRMSELGLLSGS